MTSHGEQAGVTALLSRRLVQRRQETSRRPWRDRTDRHVPGGLRGTLGRRTNRYARSRADRTNRGHFD
ncbi:MAG TPA: hypothetical protein VFM55_08540 [Micromonosporaceae bacterium]|nr:hypothetical protein [Micromonosporaceae bacterium]